MINVGVLIISLFAIQTLVLFLMVLQRQTKSDVVVARHAPMEQALPRLVQCRTDYPPSPIAVSVSNTPAPPPFRVYQSPRVAHPDFAQVGFVYTADKSAHTPLYGRPAPRNPNRWQYYTRSGSADISVGLTSVGRDCMSDIGCEELQSGDTVAAPELSDDGIHVKMYDGAM